MDISQLTEKIYSEGIEKAEHEAVQIRNQAHADAESIVAGARAQAEAILTEARSQANDEREKALTDLQLAGRKALSEIRNAIADLLTRNTLSSAIHSTMADEGFIPELIREIATRWQTGEGDSDVAVLLPEEEKKRFSAFFASREKELLDAGFHVGFSRAVKSGFQITPADGHYKISFTEDDFIAFFRPLLRERTRELLFPEHGQ